MSAAGVGWPIPSSDAFRPINEVSDGKGVSFSLLGVAPCVEKLLTLSHKTVSILIKQKKSNEEN